MAASAQGKGGKALRGPQVKGLAARKVKSVNAKKEKSTYKNKQNTRDQALRGRSNGTPNMHAGFSSKGGSGAGHYAQKSARTKDIDVHLAAKVSSELREDLANFKSRLNAADLFGADLSQMFKFVPPPFVQQHLPEEVYSLRSYISKFERGAPNIVHAFIAWYEWASYELNKGKGHRNASWKKGGGKLHLSVDSKWEEGDMEEGLGHSKKLQDEQEEDALEEEEEGVSPGDSNEKGHVRKSRARLALSKTVKEREHIRLLLQMCLRHNLSRRKEGQHAFLNHLKAKLEEDVDCYSLKSLCDTAHHTVPYALSRLLLGMVTEDFAMIILHAHALFLVLRETNVTPSILLSLVGEELSLDMRLKAGKLRLKARSAKPSAQMLENNDWDEFDPDKINDSTKSERNQRMVSAIFTIAVVVANFQKMQLDDARRVAHYLCFAYIEQKALRITTANILFVTLQHFPALWTDETVVEWLMYAFFLYPKMEYFRPEGIQLLLRLMSMEVKPAAVTKCLPEDVIKYAAMDSLEPSTVEQLANALFRKEHVTAVHPMVHPVWDDWFNILLQRCAMGESMKEHISTMLHNAIAPYRRGNADVPRRALFQQLVTRLGQLAVQNDDAQQRVELLQIANRTVGYGRKIIAKATDLSELRAMSLEMLDAKVRDLLVQYRTTDKLDPSAYASRTWVLRELRACIHVPLREGVVCTYINDVASALLQFGFFPSPPHQDERSMNRAIYLFADVFSFTYTAAVSRPKCTLSPLRVIGDYLAAEEKGKTRYTTGMKHRSFRKARNCIVDVLEKIEKRSVLFYEERDMYVLLVLIFLLLSTDDHTNEDAQLLAVSTVPDLCQFVLNGTLETLDIFYDVLMALIMRPTAPIHVMPLMVFLRRCATGYMLKFARYVCGRETLDLVLSPLREAYHTDDREKVRQLKAKAKDKAANDEEEDEDDNNDDNDDNDKEHTNESKEHADDSSTTDGDDRSDSENENDDDDDDDDQAEEEEEESDATTEIADDEGSEEEEEGDVDKIEDDDEAAGDEEKENTDNEEDDDEEGEEEEPPTQQYIDALKGMVGGVDLQFMYPVDTANKEKSDVVRAIQIATRVGAAMRSPLMVHVFQVLLAVCRENVKSPDDVVFNNVVSSIQILMMTKNRYFGRFVVAEDLFQLLSDIQSFCRKLERVLVRKDSQSVRHAAVARRRMSRLKDLSLRVFHFVTFLAHKNHAGEDVRVTLVEFYKSIFCDRGWEEKKRLPGIKRDMYHYRHGFAWALLPAALEKFREAEAIAGPQRVRVFKGCCQMIEAMLPRLSGVGGELRNSAGTSIATFLQSTSLHAVYEMKYTLLYDYLHCLKMVLKYNSRVHLDTAWVTKVVEEGVNDDTLQMSVASIRLLAVMERLLGMTPRARETKAPVPVKVLYQQFETRGHAEKAAFYRRAKRVRTKIIKALVAHRNRDPTDAERALKRQRREAMKINDRIERQVLRTERAHSLTKEEKEEKRKRIMMAKQERIAKNRERKHRLHEQRERAFQRWREEKLAAAAGTVEE